MDYDALLEADRYAAIDAPSDDDETDDIWDFDTRDGFNEFRLEMQAFQSNIDYYCSSIVCRSYEPGGDRLQQLLLCHIDAADSLVNLGEKRKWFEDVRAVKLLRDAARYCLNTRTKDKQFDVEVKFMKETYGVVLTRMHPLF